MRKRQRVPAAVDELRPERRMPEDPGKLNSISSVGAEVLMKNKLLVRADALSDAEFAVPSHQQVRTHG